MHVCGVLWSWWCGGNNLLSFDGMYYKLHESHMLVTCRSHASHMQVTCRSHASHMDALVSLCSPQSHLWLVGSHACLHQCVSGLSSHSLKQKIACKVRSEYATVRDLPPPNQTVAKMTGQAPSTSLNSETPEPCACLCMWCPRCVCGVVHG